MSDAPRPMPEILAELQAAADEVTAQRLRFGYIADTIRVNALRNGATTEQVEDFIHGRASFVNWMVELVEARGKTENAALQARVSALVEAAKGLGRWCVNELPPHPDLTPLLESLDAAITAARGE